MTDLYSVSGICCGVRITTLLCNQLYIHFKVVPEKVNYIYKQKLALVAVSFAVFVQYARAFHASIELACQSIHAPVHLACVNIAALMATLYILLRLLAAVVMAWKLCWPLLANWLYAG